MIFMYKGFNRDKRERVGYISGANKIEAINKLKEITDVKTVYYFEERIDNPLLNKLRISLLQRTRDRKKAREKREKERAKEPSLQEKIKQKIDDFSERQRLQKKRREEDERPFLERIKDFLLSDVGGTTDYDGKSQVARSIEIDWDMIESGKVPRTQGKKKKYKISDDEIIIFTKRLNMMLSSGISLSRGLDILSNHPNKHMREIIDSIVEDINMGVSFSEALSKFPEQFNITYIAMITIGEDSGNIPQTLDEIVEFMERSEQTKSKVKTASIYPAIIGVVLLATMILGSIFFIPQFRDMFGGDESALPFFTRMVFKISDLLPYIFIGCVFFGLVIRFLRRRILSFDRFIRQFVDRLKLKIPVLKEVFMSSYMYNLSSTVHIMISSGIRLKDTIDLTRRTIDNIYVQNDLANVSSLMVEGLSFSEALERQPSIDQLLTSIVLTGEESGELDRALFEISEYYNYELNTKVDNAMETIQPVLMLLVAIIAIPVIIAIYLPIFDLSTGQML